MDKAEAVEIIRKLRAEGKSLRTIGLELGVTGEYVRQIAAMFGIPKVVTPKPLMAKSKNGRGRPRVLYEWIRKPVRDSGLKDPYYAYLMHRARAHRSDIPFRLTFLEWWSYWEPYYKQRGTRLGCKVMCRKNDSGGYEIGNVRIDTVTSNAHERLLSVKCKKVLWGMEQKRHRYHERKFPEGFSINSKTLGPEEALEIERGERIVDDVNI